MLKSGDNLELKQLLLSEDYRGDEICSLVEKDPKTFFVLVELLNDQDPRVRAEAIASIWNSAISTDHLEYYLQEVHPIVGPRVLALLDDPNAAVRNAAALNVSQFPGEQGTSLLKQAIPRLLELLHDPDPEVQQSAGFSLRDAAFRIVESEPNSALQILSYLAVHANRKVRRQLWFREHQVQRFLGIRSEMTAVLMPLTRDPDKTVREQVQRIINALGMSSGSNVLEPSQPVQPKLSMPNPPVLPEASKEQPKKQGFFKRLFG